MSSSGVRISLPVVDRALMWDWEAATRRAAGQLDAFAERLDRHVAGRVDTSVP